MKGYVQSGRQNHYYISSTLLTIIDLLVYVFVYLLMQTGKQHNYVKFGQYIVYT